MGTEEAKTSVIHIAVTEQDRRRMAQRALAEGRPLSNWCRQQLLRAFEPEVEASLREVDPLRSSR